MYEGRAVSRSDSVVHGQKTGAVNSGQNATRRDHMTLAQWRCGCTPVRDQIVGRLRTRRMEWLVILGYLQLDNILMITEK